MKEHEFKNALNCSMMGMKYLPLSSNRVWKHMILNHGARNEKEVRNLIESNFDGETKKSGIYVYKRGDITLYVGQSKHLPVRFMQHYIGTFEQTGGDRTGRHYEFHKKYFRNKKIVVFWTEIEKKELDVMEEILTYLLDPLYVKWLEKWKKRGARRRA